MFARIEWTLTIRARARREESDITVRKGSKGKSKGMVQIAKSMHRGGALVSGVFKRES